MAFSTTPTEGADRLRTTADNQTINALGGNDWLRSTFNVSTLYGGNGHDRISVMLDMLAPTPDDYTRESTIYGGNGNDRIASNFRLSNSDEAGGVIVSTQNGGRGNDEIYISAASEPRETNASGAFAFTVLGGSGSDDIWVDATDADGTIQNYISGGSGHDSIYIQSSIGRTSGPLINTVNGGAGNDEIVIASGSEGALIDSYHYIRGGIGDDLIDVSIEAREGENEIDGGAGDDTITLTIVDTDFERDRGGFSTFLTGGSGDDAIRLYGRTGATIDGGDGDDTIIGGAGVDWIIGGAGADTLRGGSNDDVFLFQEMADTGDTILDFGISEPSWRGDDVISVSNIDADVAVDGNQAFVFAGTVAGGVRSLWVEEDPGTSGSLVMANNGGAELLVIAVADGGRAASEWVADDFVL